jgi:hypothetical protein
MTERREPAAHPIRDLLAFFDALHTTATGVRYPVNGGKDSKTLKDLRETYSDQDLRTFMEAFFAIEDDFISTAGYSIGIFRACLPKIIQFVKKGQQQPASKVPANLRGIEQWMKNRASGQ